MTLMRSNRLVVLLVALPALLMPQQAAIGSYPTPGNANSYGVTAGPDGAIWFTEGVADKIGRITASGVFTEYALAANSGPSFITVGPDGALWFTEYTSNKIGRITTAGAITEYAGAFGGSG